MRKLFYFLVFILFAETTYSQRFEIIGMSAEQFIRLNRSQRQYVDVNYYNGKISDLTICRDEISIDLRKKLNTCLMYMVSDDIIRAIIISYENISIEELKEWYGKKYNQIGKYYFEDNYMYCFTLYLPAVGYPTALLEKVSNIKLPTDVLSAVNQKKEELTRIEVQKRKELARIEEDKIKKENERLRQEKEAKEKAYNKFLQERETKYFQLEDQNRNLYEQIKSNIENKIVNIIGPTERTSFSIDFILSRKYDDKTKAEIKYNEEISAELKGKINSVIENIELPVIIEDSYQKSVNTAAKFSIVCKTVQQNCTVSNLDMGYILDGDSNAGRIVLSRLNSDGFKAKGTYRATYYMLTVNSRSKSAIIYNSFKGLGGSSNAFLSLLVPGLGRHFVDNTKKYPWLVTVGSMGCIGAGIYCKFKSDKSYDLYHSSNSNTPQERIDEYYQQANSQYQAALGFIAVGTAIWIYDIIWTANKGIKNRRENKSAQKNLSFYPTLSDKKQVGFGLTYNF